MEVKPDNTRIQLNSLIIMWRCLETHIEPEHVVLPDGGYGVCHGWICENKNKAETEYFLYQGYQLCRSCWHRVLDGVPPSRHEEPKKPVQYLAPVYAFLVPILQKRARSLGYAIAVHGSMNNDLDVIAVPWTFDAVSAEELITEITKGCTVFYKEDNEGNFIPKDSGGFEMVDLSNVVTRPHGRRCWEIFLGNGPRIDVSVMPRTPHLCDTSSPPST